LRFLLICVLVQAAPLSAQKGLGETARPFVSVYCTSCHNARAASGGLNLDAVLAGDVAANRDRWERIAQRIRSGEMPPPQAARPAPESVARVVSVIQSTLDTIDRAGKPDSGRVTVRRLSRYEYGKSVRDLVGIELRAGEDLPPDPYGYGFDSIGDVLSLSPALAEKYLKSAERISRIAIPVDGDPLPATMDRYLAERMDQDKQLHLSIDHVFPADGEYMLRSAWYQGLRDGVRVKLRIFVDGQEVASDIKTFYYQIDRGLETPRLPVRAGSHRIEATIEILPGAHYNGPPPYLEYIQVYGPLSQAPAATTDSYRRVFACGHSAGGHDRRCGRNAIEPLARRAYRRPLEPRELDDLIGLVDSVRGRTGSLEQGLRVGLQAILVSPNFLFRIERDAGRGERELTARELGTRLSYFLWSSLPDDALASAATQAAVLAHTRRMLADPKSECPEARPVEIPRVRLFAAR
jgi:mono/diheme cytochrome c family protein